MAVFAPVLVGAGAAGAAAYQVWNPPKRQAPESRNSPRNAQDWRLGPTDPKRELSNYWRNSINRPEEPVEDAYRSTYNNMYTNAPKLVQDSLTGVPRWITPYALFALSHLTFAATAIQPTIRSSTILYAALLQS